MRETKGKTGTEAEGKRISGGEAKRLRKAQAVRTAEPTTRLVLRTPWTALTFLLLCGSHHLPPPTPLDQLNADQRAGYDAFQTHCALCHNERTGDAKNGPSLLGVYKKPYLPSGAPANDDRISNTILHGHGLMPAQPNLDPNLDPDTLRALLAYLHTV